MQQNNFKGNKPSYPNMQNANIQNKLNVIFTQL